MHLINCCKKTIKYTDLSIQVIFEDTRTFFIHWAFRCYFKDLVNVLIKIILCLLILFQNVLGVRGESCASTWRDWVLWWASQSWTSCVSPGGIPMLCVWLDSTWHFTRARCIFNLRIFLHFFPHGQIVIMVCGCKAWFVSKWSVLMGISFSPPLGLPWGRSLIFLSIVLDIRGAFNKFPDFFCTGI